MRNVKILGLFIGLLLLTGCNLKQDLLEKQLKEMGYIHAKEFTCDDALKEGIKYIDYNYILLNNGDFYQYLNAEDQLYSNNQKCKKIETDFKVDKVWDNTLYTTDNEEYYFYYITNDKINFNKGNGMSIMKNYGKDIVNYISRGRVESNEKYPEGEAFYRYIVLKTDGVVYDQIYKYDYRIEGYYSLVEEKVLFSKDEYGKILDFRFESSSRDGNKLIISENGIYYEKEIKNDECQKYVDVKCPIEMVKSQKYDDLKDDIIFINKNYTLLKNNMIINTYFFLDEE